MNTRSLTDEPAWRDLVSRLLAGAALPIGLCIAQQHRRIRDAYETPFRAYHNLTHIAECLALLRGVSHLAEHPDEVEFAIWLHDCVYDAGRADNEERSADIAVHLADALGLSASRLQRIRRLILATRHQETPTDRDEALLVDIDLSILGAPPPRYDDYSASIRAEYVHIDDSTYRRGRAAFLRSFVQRPAIYHTSELAVRFDKPARENLRREIGGLTGAG